MNYENLSDYQINALVMNLISGSQQLYKSTESSAITLIRQVERIRIGEYVVMEEVTTLFDPCNSWADAGPIAHQYKINLYFSNNENMAEHRQTGKKSITCTDCNPCRAICIVFLIMMKGGE